LLCPDLSVHEAVEDEDKESLQTVEDGKDVGYDDGVRVHVHEPKRPSKS